MTRGGTKASASELRASVAAAAARPREKELSASVSVTVVNTNVSVSGAGVAMSGVVGPPQLGASLDLNLSNSDAPSAGNVAGAIDLGAGKHLGVSLNVAAGKDKPQLLGGGALHLGYAIGSGPIQGSLGLPQPAHITNAWSCAKVGTGC